MKKFFKIFAIVLFAGLFVGTLIYLWKRSQPKITIYNTISAVQDTLQNSTVATGNIEPRDEVLVKPQISGIISEIYCQAGQKVKTGDVLAVVKVIPEIGQLNSAESNVKIQEISLEQTKREYNRIKSLHDAGVATDEELETITTELAKNNENLTSAKESLEIIQTGISKRSAKYSNTQIRATITGVVLDVPIKVGNSVIQANTFNDGTTIASIADLGDIIFKGTVDETEIGKLSEGMDVEIAIGALQDVKLDATLEYLSPKSTMTNNIVTFEIKAAVEVPDSIFIRAGYSANATIITDKREGVLSISEAVIEYKDGKPNVNILTSEEGVEPQTFESREITTGLSDGVNIEVTTGLDGSEKIKESIRNF